MSVSKLPSADKSTQALPMDEFREMADRLGTEEGLLEALYPLVRDLLAYAQELSALAPEIGEEIEFQTHGTDAGEVRK